MILSLDQQYVRSLTQSLFGDTKVDKAQFVNQSCYYKPEFNPAVCVMETQKR